MKAIESKAKPMTPESDPKTRPLCGASSSINDEMSEWVSSIIDPVNEITDEMETISSKELTGLMDILVEKQIIEERDNSDLTLLPSTLPLTLRKLVELWLRSL